MKCTAYIDPKTGIALKGEALENASKYPDAPRCGYALEPDDVFCPLCGAKSRMHTGTNMMKGVIESEASPSAKNTISRIKLPRLSAKALKIVGGVIAAMVLTSGLVCYFTSISSSDPFGGYHLDDVVTKSQRKEMDIATGQYVDRHNSVYRPPEYEQKFVNKLWNKHYVSTLTLAPDGRVEKIVTERDFDKDLDAAGAEYDRVIKICQKLYGMSKSSRNFDAKSRETVFSVFPECKVRVSLRDSFGARVSIEMDSDDDGRTFRPMIDTKVNGSVTWTAFFEGYRSKEREFIATLESNYPQRPSEEGLEVCSACVSDMMRLCDDVKAKITGLPYVGKLELDFMTEQTGRYRVFMEKLKLKAQARTFSEKMAALEESLPFFEIYSARRNFIRKHSPLGMQAVEVTDNEKNGEAKSEYDENEASKAVEGAEEILDSGSILRRSEEQKAALRQVRFFAEKGHVPSQYLLATLILAHKAHEEEDTPAKAVELLERAAGKGHVPSMRKLGQCLLDGTGVTANSDKAAVLLKGAEEGGDGIACILLARLHRDGKSVKKDEAKVTELANKGIAILKPLAVKGDAEACSLIGQCYQLGMGVKEDDVQAKNWYSMSTKFIIARAFDGPSRLLRESKKTKELMRRPIPAIGGVTLGKRLGSSVRAKVDKEGGLLVQLKADGEFSQYDTAFCRALPVSRKVYIICLVQTFEAYEEANKFFDLEQKRIEKMFGLTMVVPKEKGSAIKQVKVFLQDLNGHFASAIKLDLRKFAGAYVVELDFEDKCRSEIEKESPQSHPSHGTAEKGDVDEQQLQSGLSHYLGNVVENKIEVLKWLREAADNGDEDAEESLKRTA